MYCPVFQPLSVASFPVIEHHWEEYGSILFAPPSDIYTTDNIPLSLCFWTVTHISVSPRFRDASVPSSSSRPSSGVTPVCLGSCTLRNPEMDSALQRRGEGSSSLTYWHQSSKHSPGCCCPPLSQGHIAGSLLTWCPPWPHQDAGRFDSLFLISFIHSSLLKPFSPLPIVLWKTYWEQKS